MRRWFGDGVVVVGVAEQFLHSSHVLVHRLGREVHHERLEHPAEEEPVGIWLRGVSNTSSTGPRDLYLTLNAPPERAPECAPTDSIAMRRL
jgi:hypothetical protein